MKTKLLITILTLLSLWVQAKDPLVVPQSLLDQVENGNSEVALFIAKSYLEGSDKFEADSKKALTWLQKSATMGNALAMSALADEYHNLDQRKKALEWYEKAAQHGVGEAFGQIGNYHMTGSAGLDKDCHAAYEWFEKAEAQEIKLAFNNHAWYLTTSSDKNCRNPERALAVYYKMKALYDVESDEIPWSFWDTEAAVLAGVSDFSGAVKLQKWLIEELKSYNVDLTNYQLHLDQYLLRKPWIEQ